VRYQPILITSLFFGVFATVILAATRYRLDWPPGGMIGFLVAVIVAVLPFALAATALEYGRAKRQAAIEALAKNLRFKFSADGSAEIAERIGKRLGGRVRKLLGYDKHEFKLHYVIEGERSGTRILVGDLQVRIERSESDDITKRTIFYFTGPNLKFPEFTLEPEEQRRKFASRLVGLLASRVGIDNPDSPLPLAGDYHVSSPEAEATKRLFGVKLQNYLASHKGWEICAEHDSILFARNGSEPVAQWEGLLDETLHILSLVNQSA
jgi:hypothetical protein